MREAVRCSDDLSVLFGLSSAVFWVGGWPFLKGLTTELKSLKPANKRIEPLQAQGKTVVIILVDGQLKGE